jgi:hypothetical protein
LLEARNAIQIARVGREPHQHASDTFHSGRTSQQAESYEGRNQKKMPLGLPEAIKLPKMPV